MLVWPVAWALPPVMAPAGAMTGSAHVYVVPAGIFSAPPLTGVIVKAAALQIVAVLSDMTAVGLTVTLTWKEGPGQLPDVGVTVYVAVADAIVVLVSVWLISACPVA